MFLGVVLLDHMSNLMQHKGTLMAPTFSQWCVNFFKGYKIVLG